ncbi:MAG: V-type ATP synthase subunit D [bacterium]
MADIKLNKTELKRQKDKLSQLSKYLPTLQLKKQQLQTVIERERFSVRKIEDKLKKQYEYMSDWAILFTQKLTMNIKCFLQIDNILKDTENVAGIDIPVFSEVIFKKASYSYFVMPAWVDRGVEEIRKLISLREELKISKKRIEILNEELRQTTIKVNLFEKRLIPEAKENIRRIKIFLGDVEIAAICNAKIAKNKLQRKKTAEAV